MSSITEISEILTEVLNETANRLEWETGFVQRESKIHGADFAQSLIFGWWQEPQITLEGLRQVLGRREVGITASGLCQRFCQASVDFFQRLLEILTQQCLRAQEPMPYPLLRAFRAVIVEDSSVIALPAELAAVWRGCGGRPGASEGGVKLYVQWDVLGGQLFGPHLSDARRNDRRSPFDPDQLPPGALYLADRGFFSQERLQTLTQRRGREKGYVVTRMQGNTGLWLRNGHKLELRGVLPRQVGEAREIGVLVGKRARLPMRLILVRVPTEAAKQRRDNLKADAKDHGREPSEEALYLADWTILLTNVPRRLLSLPQVLVGARLRWQIERLFRLWKEHGHIDEWRSKKPDRVLTEVYAKLCAMLIQQWLIHQGCWHDPHQSLFKAAQVVRREVNRLMVALFEGGVEAALRSILGLLRRVGGQRNRRKAHPGTDQLLLEGLDWPLTVLT